MYFVGKVSDNSFVENSGTYQPSDPPDSAVLANIKARLGGADEDYSIYHISNTHSDTLRVLNGDTVTLVWTGNSVTGISFAAEDAKEWISVSVDKTSFSADNLDQVLVSVSVLLANKSGIDTSFNESIDLPIQSPSGTSKYRFYLVSGVSSKLIKTTLGGAWKAPSSSVRINGYRVNNTVSFESIL